MNSFRLILASSLILACLTVFQSCLSDIEVGGGADLPLVVECVLHKAKTQELCLYQMGSIYGPSDKKPVDDAQITMLQVNRTGSEDLSTPVASFNRTGPFQWSADFDPDYGAQYMIQIVTADGDTLTGQTRFPYDQRLVGWQRTMVDTHQHLGEDFDKTYYTIYSYEVREASKEYYRYLERDGVVLIDSHYTVYRHPSNRAGKIWIFPHTDGTPVDKTCLNTPIEIEGRLEYHRDFYHHPEAFDFKGASHPYARLTATDHPRVDGFNTADGTVSSLGWCNQPLNTGSPGPMGHHYNYSQWPRILVPDLPLHRSFLRIDQPAGFNRGLTKEELEASYLCTNSSFLIISDYDADNYREISDCVNEVHFVSDEYDAYLRDLYARKESESNFILSAYDSSDMYTNIIGGVGIFGADNVTWDMLDIYVERTANGYYETTPIEI